MLPAATDMMIDYDGKQAALSTSKIGVPYFTVTFVKLDLSMLAALLV